jgi:hypothetical protein
MVPIRCVSTGPKRSLRRFLVPTNFTQQPAIFQGPLGLTSAEYSTCVLHRFETIMHPSGWVARRSGPAGPCPRRGSHPHLERYAGAMHLPMGLQGSPFFGKRLPVSIWNLSAANALTEPETVSSFFAEPPLWRIHCAPCSRSCTLYQLKS